MPKKTTPQEVWAAEETQKQRDLAQAINDAPSPAYDVTDALDVEATRSDWDALVTVARIKFPDHLALKYNLTPNERRACIASRIGWSSEKIAQAAKRDISTIRRWLAKDEAIEFCRAFDYHNGTADAKEAIDKEVFASLQILKDLRDSPITSASTRVDICKFFIESKYGKAKESKEVKGGISLRDLTEQLRASEIDDEIFDINKQIEAKKPTN